MFYVLCYLRALVQNRSKSHIDLVLIYRIKTLEITNNESYKSSSSVSVPKLRNMLISPPFCFTYKVLLPFFNTSFFPCLLQCLLICYKFLHLFYPLSILLLHPFVVSCSQKKSTEGQTVSRNCLNSKHPHNITVEARCLIRETTVLTVKCTLALRPAATQKMQKLV